MLGGFVVSLGRFVLNLSPLFMCVREDATLRLRVLKMGVIFILLLIPKGFFAKQEEELMLSGSRPSHCVCLLHMHLTLSPHPVESLSPTLP